MTFNYSTCTQRMAYSAGGTVWCIASVSGSSTFVVVYNNDTTVDDVNTFKFTCFSVSSDSSKVSMISKNCEPNQTPDTMPTRYNAANNSLVSTGARLNLTAYVLCPAVNCDFPVVYRQSSWIDSGKGEITFTNKSMSGWTMTALSQTLNNWECWNDTLFDSQGYLLLRSIDTISSAVVYYTYMCMKLTKVTDYSYYYYLVHARDSLAGQERVLVTNDDSVSDFSMICDTSAIEPTEQFHLLVKSGYQAQARQDCPNPIRGNFDYVYYDANGATNCNSTSDKWQVCIDNKTMIFDYTTCSQLMAFSAGGSVWCMASVTKTNTYVMVYNNDTTIDNNNTYRFSCFAVSQSSNSSSLSPKNCSESQTPETFPKDQIGKNTGALLTMKAYVSQENTCSFPSDFRYSVWQDSTKGDISFTNTTMSGWDITIDGHTVNTWKCLNDSWFETKGILVLK
ncbi:hypothetical protein CHS0354_025222 [Potamilus streckersoni]|uniref:DUF7042 domain-containing protein n=1 Tax=Potamilus streckersoni TaxID=2493646 RepID=A0AAE0RNM7_9BIVA|nr:hypothetical protein CHS0354_025222 [Potamilus streckersoni]